MSDTENLNIGKIKTVQILNGVGKRNENYRIDVEDEYGKTRQLLLTPSMFFHATRLFSREFLCNPDAA